eukprot:9484111-Pyramimonas_sp.AAC.1
MATTSLRMSRMGAWTTGMAASGACCTVLHPRGQAMAIPLLSPPLLLFPRALSRQRANSQITPSDLFV